VYTITVKNITLSADEHLIERARQTAQAQHKTLNTAFREWLEQYVSQNEIVLPYSEVKRRLAHVRAGRKYTRDEMNERR
jgi:predicted transcriptional regulator